MAYAIMRWAKITSQTQANKATGHNYRQDKVLNADEQAPHPNVELVNTAERGYWELAEERIAEVVTRKVRDDQVRCMEVILTASPEFFERDANGRALNMSQSQWLKDQLTFLEKKFGKENVLSCTLHQDEKSPHVHAVIAPITEDGRLSAKLLFNPKTLTDYQSQYGEAMKAYGLERGVEHSEAKHQPMERLYTQQQQVIGEVGPQLGPVMPYQEVQIKPPSRLELLRLDKWAAETSAQINAQTRAQVEAAHQFAAQSDRAALEAQKLAYENATAKEQVQVLRKQLNTSEGLKESHYTSWQGEVAKGDDLARRLAGGEAAPAVWLARGNELLDQDVQAVEAGRKQVNEMREQAKKEEKAGDYGKVAVLLYGPIVEEHNEREKQLASYDGGAVRLKKLDTEQADEAKKKTEDERKAKELATQKANKQAEDDRQAETDRKARVEEQARELAERQRKQREENQTREKAQIERICLEIIPKNFYTEGYQREFIREANKLGIEVKVPSPQEYVLSVKGSEHQFAHYDLQVGKQSFTDAFNQQHNTNWKFREDHEREQGKSQALSRD